MPRRRCSDDVGEDVDLIGHRGTEPAAVWPVASRDGPGGTNGPVERKDGVALSTPPGRGGVRADLEHVFRSAYPRVVAVAARVLGSRDEAEDVAQEVFLSFARSAVPAAAAPGWLSVSAAHTALNLIRSGKRRTAREEAAAGGDPVVPDVAEAVVARDEHSHVRAALARLPRTQAVALVLRHSGLSYAEVAAALDLSPGSVGTTVRRAESALRKELNRHASSD
jgi:RNA polymerase sigma-70 factor (ECF subfamily)